MRKLLHLGLILTTAATLATLASSPASAKPSLSPADFTFTVQTSTTISTRMIGNTTIITADRTSILAGTYAGEANDTVVLILHPNGVADAAGAGTCQCTVDGRSGTLHYAFEGSGPFPASASGRYAAWGSDGLATLRGSGPFSGSWLVAEGTGYYAFGQ